MKENDNINVLKDNNEERNQWKANSWKKSVMVANVANEPVNNDQWWRRLKAEEDNEMMKKAIHWREWPNANEDEYIMY